MTTREKEEKGIESVPCTGETAESQADDSAAETMIAGVETESSDLSQPEPEETEMAKKDSPTRKLIRRMLKLKALKGNTKKRLVTKSNKMGST